MKSAVICILLLALLQGNVFAGVRFGLKNKTKNEDAEIFPNPGKPAASNTSHSGRIVNGSEGRSEYFPYLVHLRVENSDGSGHTCGASIITYSHAFTAAHCVYNKDDALVTLYAGSASRTSGGTVFEVTSIEVHPYYNPNNLQYDAAIVEVSDTFEGYNNISPIVLQDDEVPAGTWCYAVGWGINNYAARTSPDNVQYAYLQAFSSEQCSAVYPAHNTVICAQRGSGVDICFGDSGGPFVCDGKLTGASSFVGEGCRGEQPAGFAKVMNPAIREFIRMFANV